jgi:hypothetical protein
MFGNNSGKERYNNEKIIFSRINKCCTCEENESNIKYYSQTSTYYRNKASGHHYFCCEKCKNIFDNTKM